jgi:hypothetical protein
MPAPSFAAREPAVPLAAARMETLFMAGFKSFAEGPAHVRAKPADRLLANLLSLEFQPCTSAF